MHRSTRVLVAPFRSFLPNARSSLAYVWGIPAGPGLMSEQAERACSSRCALHGLHQQYNRLHGLGTAQYNRLHQTPLGGRGWLSDEISICFSFFF